MRTDRLETESIVVGYVMSRLDRRYLAMRGLSTWRAAYEEAAAILTKPPLTFKNLRDEFDPFHENPRTGWANRGIRLDRQRVLDELYSVSDEALIELVERILQRDIQATVEAIESLAVVTNRAANVAERLLTGKRAEEFFIANSNAIIQVDRTCLVDLRLSALGYDFGIRDDPRMSIEVKGLKRIHGDIQFTDREWSEASLRRQNYLLVVVGNLAADPIAKVFRDPVSLLVARCEYRTTVAAVWRSQVNTAN
jgi:hypothetical protein